MIGTPAFCPPNVSISDIWINHGISQCFIDTLCSSVLAGFILLFGTAQLIIFKKYSVPIDANRIRTSWIYKMQMSLMLLLPFLETLRLLLRWELYEKLPVYGFMIFYTASTILANLFAICLINKERHHQLPSVGSRSHGKILLIFFAMTFIAQNITLININSTDWWFKMESKADHVEMTLFVARYICTFFIFVLGLKAPGLTIVAEEDEEPLGIESDENQSTFKIIFGKFRMLMPFLWPQNDLFLQLRVFVCLGLLIAVRVINVYVPIYSKKIIDSLSSPSGFHWDWILIYVGLKYLQGGGADSMGMLNNLRSFLWIKIQQYSTRTIEVELFRHLHSLSLRWHLGRKTGEVLRVMDRGTESINNLINHILFLIAPAIIDIIIAIFFFITAFNWMFGLIVFITMGLYMIATIAISEWRIKFKRRQNVADNEQRTRSVDSLLNFETVKYYGAENFEVESYHQAVVNYQKEEFTAVITLNYLNMAQNFIFCFGLIAGSLLCAWMVATEKDNMTVGGYVLFTMYIIQLYVPLNWFGTYYRQIQRYFVDMENMLDLMMEQRDVFDEPGAPGLIMNGGEINFSNVTFGYSPELEILHDVTFSVAPGKTVAIVGPSGAGKSTIMRLLFRFYDVTSGAITIDSQHIKAVTQSSLRRAIGVVPQDTVLFNQTISYNIRYGRHTADEHDVIDAAKNADIHEKILAFPEQYKTQVGERGLRLSGGEKQRVAIARTFLKGPQIVLLDEATSSLDTQTERNIQSALAKVCSNKTTLIIAHRLSTIIHADEILVLKNGEIVERGKHGQLLDEGGLYAEMWNQQLKNLEAKKLRDERDKE